MSAGITPMNLTFNAGVVQAQEQGHDMEADPAHDLSSVSRCSCKRCGRAVLRYNGHVYGSALTDPCFDR